MALEWVQTDSGSHYSVEYLNENKTGDCVLRAFSVFTGWDFTEVKDFFCDMADCLHCPITGNPTGMGVKLSDCLAIAELLNFTVIKLDKEDVYRIPYKYPNCIIFGHRLRDEHKWHAMALKDGVIYDRHDSRYSYFAMYIVIP